MTLALAALVLSSLCPSAPVVSVSLGQAKIQIIKGGKKGGAVKAAPVEPSAQAPAVQVDSGKAQELDRKSSELDAKDKDLAQREQALQEKETTASDADKKKADQQKAQLKHIEKISEQNQQMMQQASDSLAGD